MSASLVGSEMCIRDRVWVGGPSGTSEGLKTPLFDDSWKNARCSRSVPSRCLLYTSDAADDM
eukprot:9678878-Alexandrium_andersonii.AAC.1